MTSTLPYTEENFGILTDDDLYLDCILVKPIHTPDHDVRVLRTWVPKYPLTKSSVITCARQEVKSYGPNGKIANLVFDLRGTGDSDGVPGDHNFQLDLQAIQAWAAERFGRINFGFFGFPYSEHARTYMWPLRAGIVMESYYYPPSGSALTPPCILYLSSYGNFSRTDDALCAALAQAGYSVYGLDPFRYLLHASANNPLTPDDLWEDLRLLVQMLPNKPILIGQPLAAGLVLLWAARVKEVKGVIAIGRAQSGMAPSHIFQNHNPHNFLLARHIPKISPCPLVVVMHLGHPMGGSDEKLVSLYESSREPRRLERTDKVNGELLLELIEWIEENVAPHER